MMNKIKNYLNNKFDAFCKITTKMYWDGQTDEEIIEAFDEEMNCIDILERNCDRNSGIINGIINKHYDFINENIFPQINKRHLAKQINNRGEK